MRLRRKQIDQAPARPEDAGMSARVLSQILEASTRVQAPAVRAYVTRLRNSNPNATPAEIVTKLEKRYLAAVMASGAAVGSAAAFPGIGTLAALSAVAGETLVFLEATALFVLAVAEVHGIGVGQRDRRRALVLSVLVGEDSRGAITEFLGPGRTSGAWLAETELLPLPVVSQMNSKLMQYFVKKYTIKRTAAISLVDTDAVHFGDREDEQCGGFQEHQGLPGDRRERGQRADTGERGGGSDGGTAGHHRGQIVLLQFGDDIGRGGVRIGVPKLGHISPDGRSLDPGARLEDLRENPRRHAGVGGPRR